MKIKEAILSLCICVSVSMNAQSFQWAKSFGGGDDEVGFSSCVDASGNVYTAGYFGGTVDFDPGPGTANLTAAGGGDIFIQKLDASGNFLWARAFGGDNDDVVKAICLDASGNIYTTGHFQGTVDFDPGNGVSKLTATDFYDDIFVHKMDASGNFLWAKAFGGLEYDGGNFICVDSSGNVYTTGYFGETADFDPGAGSFMLTSTGANDLFVQKLDASGNFIWVKGLGGTLSDAGNSICVDATGNIYITGDFQGIVDFDPGAGVFNLNSSGGRDIFICKLNASGNFLWAKGFGGTGNESAVAIRVDASGNIYSAGGFEGTVDFDPGSGMVALTSAGEHDVFIQKMDASGNFIWAKAIGGKNAEDVHSLSVDATGNVYSTGIFYETADFDPGSGIANLSSAGSADIFVHKLDASGNFLWVRTFGDTAFDEANALCLDNTGNIYISGGFQGNMDFDPGSGTANLSSTGFSDIFVLKWSQTPTGLPEPVKDIRLSAYPNPFRGWVQLSFFPAMNDVEIVVTNVTGKICYSGRFKTIASETIQINGDPGMYFLTIKTSEGQNMIKMIKE